MRQSEPILNTKLVRGVMRSRARPSSLPRRCARAKTPGSLAVLLVISCLGGAAHADDEAPKNPTAVEQTSSSLSLETKEEFSAYVDTDAVSVITPAVEATLKDPLAGWSATGSYLVDVVSAASVDIVSTASTHWTEVRHAAALSGSVDIGDTSTSIAGSISREPDYLSLSGGATERIEFAHKTVTPVVGYSFTRDVSGRTGTPFSVYSLVLHRHTVTGGLELILDPTTLVTLGADASFESGRQEKPYRFVPLFAPNVADQISAGASIATVNALRLPGRASERVPDSRKRFSVSARLAQRISGWSTFAISERLYQDDWGLKASTTDLRMLMDASARWFIWTHFRVHVQSGVSFWHRAYVGRPGPIGIEVPALRTGDRELSPLASGTFGGGIRWLIGRDTRPDAWSLLFQTDVLTTSFTDALFIQNRQAFFNSLALEGKF